MLNFSRFAVEQHPACNFDYLQIHDGSTAAHHRIGKYCGNHPPNGGTVNTTQRSAYLWFHSDQSFSHDGFAVTWRAVQPGKLTLALAYIIYKTKKYLFLCRYQMKMLMNSIFANNCQIPFIM